MQAVLVWLAFLTALIPVARQGYEQWQAVRASSPSQIAAVAAQPLPPEVGQVNVIFYQGNWWKYDNGVWLMWQPTPVRLAGTEVPYVAR